MGLRFLWGCVGVLSLYVTRVAGLTFDVSRLNVTKDPETWGVEREYVCADWWLDHQFDDSHDLTVRPYTNLPTAKACQEACKLVKECKYFTWRPPDVPEVFDAPSGNCMLKGGRTSGYKVSRGAVSGDESCGDLMDITDVRGDGMRLFNKTHKEGLTKSISGFLYVPLDKSGRVTAGQSPSASFVELPRSHHMIVDPNTTAHFTLAAMLTNSTDAAVPPRSGVVRYTLLDITTDTKKVLVVDTLYPWTFTDGVAEAPARQEDFEACQNKSLAMGGKHEQYADYRCRTYASALRDLDQKWARIGLAWGDTIVRERRLALRAEYIPKGSEGATGPPALVYFDLREGSMVQPYEELGADSEEGMCPVAFPDWLRRQCAGASGTKSDCHATCCFGEREPERGHRDEFDASLNCYYPVCSAMQRRMNRCPNWVEKRGFHDKPLELRCPPVASNTSSSNTTASKTSAVTSVRVNTRGTTLELSGEGRARSLQRGQQGDDRRPLVGYTTRACGAELSFFHRKTSQAYIRVEVPGEEGHLREIAMTATPTDATLDTMLGLAPSCCGDEGCFAFAHARTVYEGDLVSPRVVTIRTSVLPGTYFAVLGSWDETAGIADLSLSCSP